MGAPSRRLTSAHTAQFDDQNLMSDQNNHFIELIRGCYILQTYKSLVVAYFIFESLKKVSQMGELATALGKPLSCPRDR